jgi:hypothetical protein
MDDSHFPPRPLPRLTTFIYSYQECTDELWRTDLVTGVQSCHRVPGYIFRSGCCWTELPDESLLITGGDFAEREVVKIDTCREFAVSPQAPMLTPRSRHTAVYHSQYVYALGGLTDDYLSECERYACADSRWEVLPALPVACVAMSAVVVESSLYALGGFCQGDLDCVQKLALDSLTWELMQLRLPQAGGALPCLYAPSAS